jgi:hypothetical protein
MIKVQIPIDNKVYTFEIDINDINNEYYSLSNLHKCALNDSKLKV